MSQNQPEEKETVERAIDLFASILLALIEHKNKVLATEHYKYSPIKKYDQEQDKDSA